MWANVIKIVLGLALLGLALSQVQWRDVLEERNAEGAVVARYAGRVTRLEGDTVWLRVVGEVTARPFALTTVGAGETQRVLRWGLRALMSRIPLTVLGIASALYLLAIFLASLRWWWLLHLTHLPLGFDRALSLTWVGLFFNNFLPGQTGGDVAKGLYLLKACPQARVPAVGSLVLDRVLGFMGLLLLALLALLGARLHLGSTLQAWIWGLFLSGGCGLGLLLSRRVRYHVQRYLHGVLPRWIGVRLGQMETALLLYRRQWLALIGCFSLGVLNQICVIFSVALLGRAVGLELPWTVFFVLLPLLLLVGALPLAPNGWGVGELSFGYLFAAYGASFNAHGDAALFYTQGVALSVLFRLLMLAWSLPGGVFWLLWRTPGDVSSAWAAGGRAHG